MASVVAKSFRNASIRVNGFESDIVEGASLFLKSIGANLRCNVRGPTPLPQKIKKFTVNRSPHVHKKSMQAFEVRTYSRVLTVENTHPDTVRAYLTEITKQHLPGVGIRIVENSAEELPKGL